MLRRLGMGAIVLASVTVGSIALAAPSYTAYGEMEAVFCYGSGFTPNGSVGIGTVRSRRRVDRWSDDHGRQLGRHHLAR